MKHQLILPHYNGDITELICRNERGQKKTIDAPKIFSYFYVKEGSIIPENDPRIVYVDKEGDYKGLNGEKLWKIETRQPNDVKGLRYGFQQHWEADIPYVRRCMIDLGITSGFDSDLRAVNDWGMKPSILTIDIETLSLDNKRSWKADMKTGRLAVAMIAFKFVNWNDETTNIQFILDPDIDKTYKEWDTTHKGDKILKIFFKTEVELLTYYWILLKKLWPDIITGWNVKFDTTYPLVRSWVLSKRYNNLRKYVQTAEEWNRGKQFRTNDERAKDFYLYGQKVLLFDLMYSYAELYKPQSKKLKLVSKDEGIADREHETGGIFHKLFWEDRKEAARYNWDDVWETWEINKKHDIIGFYWENKNFAGMETINLSIKAGNLLDTVLLRLAGDEVCLPSRPEIKKKEKGQFEGAYVFEPEQGVYYNVSTLDASRYYPSIILAYEKLFYPIVIKLVKYVSKGRDIVEKALDKLTKAGQLGSDLWKSISKRRDSRKFLLNAVYGTLGDMKFRLFNLGMASKITALCRKGIKAVAEYCKKIGLLVVGGDTDSVFVQLEAGDRNPVVSDLVNKGTSYVENINKFLHTYFKTDKSYLIEFKMEKIWQPMVMTDKKKMYFGRVTWQDGEEVDRVVVRGLKTRRRDTSNVTTKVLK